MKIKCYHILNCKQAKKTLIQFLKYIFILKDVIHNLYFHPFILWGKVHPWLIKLDKSRCTVP